MKNLLVAVDGSQTNRAALDWAIAEAERTDTAVTIAVVAETWQEPALPHLAVAEPDVLQPIVDEAVEVATAVLGQERVKTQVSQGPALSVLLDLAEGHSGLVVGRRGMGAIKRVLIGSTSIAVAGRSSTPVTVVPGEWDDHAAAARPVLIGLDLDQEHDAAVRYAFSQAKTRGVSLQVLQAWRMPPVIADVPGALISYYSEWQTVALEALKVYIDRISQEFPGVEVVVSQEIGHPVDLLVETAESAQLLVLGRDEKERWTGFALGSVARNVLPHCDVPVAVVPAV